MDDRVAGPVARRPLVFVSHDTRDAEYAAAFSRLLSSVSAGLLRTFRSSDQVGTQGIEYGREWYPAIMEQLDEASDVVCLLTPRSLNRPWILYEAGVAKGKLDVPAYGLALGISLSDAIQGPFAQFQNCAYESASICKLVLQLLGRIPGAEPDAQMVLEQVARFIESVDGIAPSEETTDDKGAPPSAPALFEEIKLMFQDLPGRLGSTRLAEPGVFEDVVHSLASSERRFEATGALILASEVRTEAPWLYAIARAAYGASIEGNTEAQSAALKDLSRGSELLGIGPAARELVSPEGRQSMRRLREFLERAGYSAPGPRDAPVE